MMFSLCRLIKRRFVCLCRESWDFFFLGKGNKYIPTVCWGRPTRNLATVCMYVSPPLGTRLREAHVLKDDIDLYTFLSLPLKQPVEPVYLFPGSTQINL